jgi:superoxide dismutase
VRSGAIDSTFGSFDTFRAFHQAQPVARLGLAVDGRRDALRGNRRGPPLSVSRKASWLRCLEHAYLKYQNRRPDYGGVVGWSTGVVGKRGQMQDRGPRQD